MTRLAFFSSLLKNGCPWLSRRCVTKFAEFFFSSLLKLVVLGSPVSE